MNASEARQLTDTRREEKRATWGTLLENVRYWIACAAERGRTSYTHNGEYGADDGRLAFLREKLMDDGYSVAVKSDYGRHGPYLYLEITW